jgi:hypothetical protein
MSDRILHLTSPQMRGGDVLQLQHTINGWLGKWHIPRRLECDGVYGVDSRTLTLAVCYGLGIAKAETEHGIAPATRLKLRDPARRSLSERRRCDGRAHWRSRLKHRFHAHGPLLAVAYARKMAALGVHEQPAGSNRGPHIDDWNRAAGIPPGPNAFWCGAFCNGCLVAAGFAPQTFMASCINIESHARGGADGWKWQGPTAIPRAGWLALFTEKGVAGHVELVVADGRPLKTIGGNTSPMAGTGSVSNGGGVFAHDFSRYRGLPLRGFAVPPYH